MISTVRVLVIVVVLVRNGGSGQQCTELFCPGNRCLSRNSVCNGTAECLDGRGSNFDEINCSGKRYIVVI